MYACTCVYTWCWRTMCAKRGRAHVTCSMVAGMCSATCGARWYVSATFVRAAACVHVCVFASVCKCVRSVLMCARALMFGGRCCKVIITNEHVFSYILANIEAYFANLPLAVAVKRNMFALLLQAGSNNRRRVDLALLPHFNVERTCLCVTYVCTVMLAFSVALCCARACKCTAAAAKHM